ncbi:hypothetical protein SESBI_06309 [Sesbania bispinosa]|nr:hypothetical protein SESBI_06309 [Sesbania bispinosa]
MGNDENVFVVRGESTNLTSAVEDQVQRQEEAVGISNVVSGLNEGGVSCADDKDNESSDESLKDIHFDDSEEERDLGLDDGFDLLEVGEVEVALTKELEKMKELAANTQPAIDEAGPSQHFHKYGPSENFDDSVPSQNFEENAPSQMVDDGIVGDNSAHGGDAPSTEVPQQGFLPQNVANMHQIEDEYSSEELESDCYDNNVDDSERPHYPTYKKDEMWTIIQPF